MEQPLQEKQHINMGIVWSSGLPHYTDLVAFKGEQARDLGYFVTYQLCASAGL